MQSLNTGNEVNKDGLQRKGERDPSFFSCIAILKNCVIVTNFLGFISKNFKLGVVQCVVYYFIEKSFLAQTNL